MKKAGYEKMKSERRKFVMMLVFAVLFATLVFVSVGCASAATHYVCSGESIQTAVDNADAGDTIFVYNGSYTENVDVNKRLTMIGEGADVVTVTAKFTNDTVFHVTANWVNISGFTMTGATVYEKDGIALSNSNYCNISANNLSNNSYGIQLLSSSNNMIANNNVANDMRGIFLMWSGNNTIANNNASNNSYGIQLYCSSNNNTIINNTANSNSYGIYMTTHTNRRYSSNNNTIANNNASNNYRGIWLGDSSNNTLQSNTANSNSQCGIYTDSSSDTNMLSNNTANSNNGYGIYLYFSNNNTLTNNTANLNSDYGIYLHSSNNTTLKNNTMSKNEYNFAIFGGDLFHYIQNIDTSNLVNEKPIYYWVDRQNKQVPSDAGFVGIVNSTNITVRDMTLASNGEGVLLAYTSNSMVENVTTTNIAWGIDLYSSSNNTIANNNASNNNIGICLFYSSNNTLQNNTADSNNDHGIYLHSSSNNTIANNNASNNNIGIFLFSSSGNTITDNTANSNYGYYGYGIHRSSYLPTSGNNTLKNNNCSNNCYGIYLNNVYNNSITCNWVQNNTQKGFRLYGGSTNNNISYNNIIENGNYNSTTGGYEWQFYNDQNDDVDAMSNWWGTNDEMSINASIYDRNDDPSKGTVIYLPRLNSPASCPLTPEEPHASTIVDAMVALEIAVGNRSFESRMDVNHDDTVTSLDALMILQAAAGAISL